MKIASRIIVSAVPALLFSYTIYLTWTDREEAARFMETVTTGILIIMSVAFPVMVFMAVWGLIGFFNKVNAVQKEMADAGRNLREIRKRMESDGQ